MALMKEKLFDLIQHVKCCQACWGKGVLCYGDGSDYFDWEWCDCNIYRIEFDEDGEYLSSDLDKKE